MDWGHENRMARMIKPSTGRTVMLAIDHGYFQGPTSGLEQPGKTVESIITYCDALSPTRGVLRYCINPKTDVPIILRISGGNSMARPDDLSDEVVTTCIEEAIRLNACAVSVSVYVGAANQRQSIQNLALVVDEAARYGIPVLGITAVGKDMARDARYLGLATRILAEVGAHIVKTYYCENFEQVVRGCPAPIVIAGGKKVPELEALEFTYKAVNEGAVGVDMGRNIFQSEHPVAMIRAVRAIVHDKASVSAAHDLFNQLEHEG